MKKLSIIIPQYKEDVKTIRKLLDSIEIQAGIDFAELEVLIVNDCSDAEPPPEIVKDYSFEIKLLRTDQNGGAGLTRQYGIERAKGKYILFIDADDMLMSCIALKWFWNYKGNADVIRAKFFNESLSKVDNGWTWVHGKFYRRKFLIESGVKFIKELRVNEDAYFNMLVGAFAKNKIDIDEIVAFWSNNQKSTTRENTSEFVVSCFGDFLKGKLLGFRELQKRNAIEELKANLIDLFVYVYYYIQTKEFYRGNDKVQQKRIEYEIKVAEIVKEFWKYFSQFTESDFDAKLFQVFETFKGYVDYRLRETFDDYRTRIYSYEI